MRKDEEVKFVRASNNRFVFHLAKRDKRLLQDVLKLYPRIPPGHQRLTKGGKLPDAEASEQLLNEALAEQRAENKERVRAFLESPKRFVENETGSRLSLSPTELEWLLQVLNDIRVGSWVLLGSPEPRMELRLLNEKTAPDFWAMEMSGYFQAHLLEATEGA